MRELSLNVMDIVQNSISAKALLVEIDVLEDEEKDILSIRIADNGCGMTKEQVEHVIDPFYTTRTTRKVGLGVPLFKMEAEMTGGSFDITSTPGMGTVLQANFKPSSVDMIPLGDIDTTVHLLITCNPHLDFCFKRSRKQAGREWKEFTLDTRQLREVLGEDISLNAPDVAQWMKEFLTEQTEELLQP